MRFLHHRVDRWVYLIMLLEVLLLIEIALIGIGKGLGRDREGGGEEVVMDGLDDGEVYVRVV